MTANTAPASVPAFSNIRIVLVNTTHPGNIGAAARAMKNMGLSRLYLVEPKTYPSEEATWRSGHASDILDGAIVCPDLAAAIEGCSLVVGTSARERKIPWPLLNPRETALKVQQELSLAPNNEIALVFGREDRGLTNDELQSCHLHLNIPTNPEYSSLNLAAAVQVVAYELRMTFMGDGLEGSNSAPDRTLNSENALEVSMRDWDVPIASHAMLEHFYQHLEQSLVNIEFLEPKAKRQVMTRFRRLFHRSRMDEMEVQMMRGLLKRVDQLVQKLEKH